MAFQPLEGVFDLLIRSMTLFCFESPWICRLSLLVFHVDVGDGPKDQVGERLSRSPGKYTGMLAFDGSVDGACEVHVRQSHP